MYFVIEEINSNTVFFSNLNLLFLFSDRFGRKPLLLASTAGNLTTGSGSASLRRLRQDPPIAVVPDPDLQVLDDSIWIRRCQSCQIKIRRS